MYKIQPSKVLIATEFEETIRSWEFFLILSTQSMIELWLIAIQLGNLKERIKHKIKSVTADIEI